MEDKSLEQIEEQMLEIAQCQEPKKYDIEPLKKLKRESTKAMFELLSHPAGVSSITLAVAYSALITECSYCLSWVRQPQKESGKEHKSRKKITLNEEVKEGNIIH